MKIKQIQNPCACKDLFESEQLTPQVSKVSDTVEGINKQQLQIVFAVKSKQFVFDCGAVMANMKTDTGNLMGLKYHADKSSNVDEFIDSVSKFISTSGESITEGDKERLRKEYSKWPKK